MAGLASRVQIVSNALLLLGVRPISSLDDTTTGAILGSNLFQNTYYAMLQQHRWRFAVKTQSLSKLSAKPNTGYTTAFVLPTDYLYAFKGDQYDYAVYGSEIHSNSQSFTLDYVATIEEDMLPAYFVLALEYNLASQFAIPITGDIDKASYFSKVFANQLKSAKFVDSTQYPEVAVVHSPYTQVRN